MCRGHPGRAEPGRRLCRDALPSRTWGGLHLARQAKRQGQPGTGGRSRRAGSGVAGCLLPSRAARLFHFDHTIFLGLGCQLTNLYVTEVHGPRGQEAPISPPTGRPPGLHLCHIPLFDRFNDNYSVYSVINVFFFKKRKLLRKKWAQGMSRRHFHRMCVLSS